MTAHNLPAKPSSLLPHSATSVLDASFAAIDWQAPWLSHLSHVHGLSKTVERLGNQANRTATADTRAIGRTDYGATVIADVLNTALQQQSDGLPYPFPQTKPTHNNQAHALKFVSQDALPEGEAYEHFIATTGKIPTRDNLHDLFNGSIWLVFPKTKALLNYHHMCAIAKQGVNESRGRIRDTITVFDENGAIVVTADSSIGEALIDFDWQASLVTPRASWDNPRKPNAEAQAAVYIFGHALLEQLLQPRKPLCAHSVVIKVTSEFFSLELAERLLYLDNKLAEYMHNLLSQADVTPRILAPLPILGVPHFWAENADSGFYDDRYVFRSGRRQQA